MAPFPEKRAESVVSFPGLFKPFLNYFIFCGWSALGQGATTPHPIFANMNKTSFFTAVILSFGLPSAQAVDKVHFEDSDFSKEGWSDFAEIPGTGGWEVKRRKLGELAQAVRKGSREKQLHELGDVLAWLASLAVQLDLSLDDAVSRYVGGCPRCDSVPCDCPNLSIKN